jgi:hypothetical protein
MKMVVLMAQLSKGIPGLVLVTVLVVIVVAGIVCADGTGSSPVTTSSKITWSWKTGTIDTGNFGTFAPLVFDLFGRPHLSYTTVTDTMNYTLNLEYSTKDRTGWRYETVDSSGTALSSPSLAVASDGTPSILYGYLIDSDGPVYGTKLARRSPAGWSVETLPMDEETGGVGSLAIDSSGKIHAAYPNGPNFDMTYAWKDKDGWHTEFIDSGITDYVVLCVDAYGRPSLVYTRWTDSIMPGNTTKFWWRNQSSWRAGSMYDVQKKYAWKDSAGWHTDVIDEGPLGWPTAFTIDQGGNPKVVYVVITGLFTPDTLMYAWKDTAGWHTQTIISDRKYSPDISLALDQSGNPRFSLQILNPTYYDFQSLDYAYRDQGRWNFEPVTDDTQIEIIGSPSLAYNRNGYWAIAFPSADVGPFNLTEITMAERIYTVRPPVSS